MVRVVVEHQPRDARGAEQRRVGQLYEVEQVAVGGLVRGGDAQRHYGGPACCEAGMHLLHHAL